MRWRALLGEPERALQRQDTVIAPIVVADAYAERTRQIAAALISLARNAGEPVR